jgi:regulator of nucleoside diphosphate kinase
VNAAGFILSIRFFKSTRRVIVRKNKIVISSADRFRLFNLIDSARLDSRVPAEHLRALEEELARAALVEHDELPPDVVAMHSTVWFRDLDTEEVEKYTLVYPSEADVTHDRISVLAPIGTALLGFRVGDIVRWRVPLGTRHLEITKVAQRNRAPEAEKALV